MAVAGDPYENCFVLYANRGMDIRSVPYLK